MIPTRRNNSNASATSNPNRDKVDPREDVNAAPSSLALAAVWAGLNVAVIAFVDADLRRACIIKVTENAVWVEDRAGAAGLPPASLVDPRISRTVAFAVSSDPVLTLWAVRYEPRVQRAIGHAMASSDEARRLPEHPVTLGTTTEQSPATALDLLSEVPLHDQLLTTTSIVATIVVSLEAPESASGAIKAKKREKPWAVLNTGLASDTVATMAGSPTGA